MGILRHYIEMLAESVQKHDEDAFVLDVPMSLQLNRHSCGVESTFAVLSFFEIEKTRREVKHELGASFWGVDEHDIMRALGTNGLPYKVMKGGTTRRLRNALHRGCPTIVCLDGDTHWGVVYGASDDHLMLMDPDPLNMFHTAPTEEEFVDRWEGWGIVVG